MPREERQPIVTEKDGERIYEHPAYGCVAMSVVYGGKDVMFGSDLLHGQRVRLRVRTAEMRRTLSNDWHFGRRTLLEFDMSHSQFAEMITSGGKGDGVPCTLVAINGESIPGIAHVETKQELMRREVRDAANNRIAGISADLERLAALIDSGKVGKTALKEIHRDLSVKVGGLPNTMEFVVAQAEETIDKATNQAKIEIEAVIQHHVANLGVEAAKALHITQKASQIQDAEE
ncbi:hypothetical protein [Herbaspirillum huttiense]|uniref:Uncharacterized protein n=1 Tax=Herbaspirillum huttiense subsp. lycopersici TaxID=3074428 RepID=A0ABU2EGL7_9BURK|nr:hypothetical protein [Herbaspirillum huttiense]MDR9846983.1 hypothetical protein [Herbaspirillum huttiense SE1]